MGRPARADRPVSRGDSAQTSGGGYDDTNVDVTWIRHLDGAAARCNRRGVSLEPHSHRAALSEFRADEPHGSEWYRRAMRAHANCVENLPVFGAIVLVISAIGVTGPAVNYLCTSVLIARVCQSLVHVSHVQTDAFVAVRFSFFCVQLACFLALIVIAVCHGV